MVGSSVLAFVTEVVMLCYSALVGVFSLIRYLLDPHTKERRRMVKGMREAEDYAEWYQSALEYCNSYGFYQWRKHKKDDLFDYREITHRISGIRTLLNEAKSKPSAESTERLMLHLRSDMVRGPCGICNTTAFTYTIGTKRIIEEYLEAIQEAIGFIAGNTAVAPSESYKYLTECCRCHGLTALLLSGGQSLSMYHMGVCRGLFRMGVLPQVLCATGTAAVVASYVCTTTDTDLEEFFKDGSAMYEKFSFDKFHVEAARKQTTYARSRSSLYESDTTDAPKEKDEALLSKMGRRFKRFCETGTFMDINVVADFVAVNIGDLTFREAFEKTGRILNIVISNLSECSVVIPHTEYTVPQSVHGDGETKWVANYLTAPDVLIRSAAVAAISHGFVGRLLWKGYELLRKDPITGKIEPFSPSAYHSSIDSAESMAIERIREQFNVTCVIRVRTQMSFTTSSHPPKAVTKSFSRRLCTETLNEVRYRVDRVLRFAKGFRMCKKMAVKLLSLDCFLRDVEVDVDITSYDGASMNVLEKPTSEIATKRMLEGEHSLWPLLAKTQHFLAVEDSLHRALLTVGAKLESPDILMADSFPFPEIIAQRTFSPARTVVSGFAHPFPSRSMEELEELVSVTPNTSFSKRECLVGKPSLRSPDTYDSGYSGSMVMRHLARRSSTAQNPFWTK